MTFVSDSGPAVEASSLTHRYRAGGGLKRLFGSAQSEVAALTDVSFALAPGEVFGLVGPNGAGKTTLINIFCTMLLPSSGRALVAGCDVARDARMVRGLVGVVTSNERSFYWRLTGRENLRFFADLYRVQRDGLDAWIDELLDGLGLSRFADARFDGYSTGMRQRLAFARALLHRPRILFLDEPTRGLDPGSAKALLQLLQDRIIATWRPTILLTSHNLREVERLSHRIGIMARGRLLRCGTLEAIQREEALHGGHRLLVQRLPPAAEPELSALPDVLFVRRLDSGSDDVEVRITGIAGALPAVLRWLVGAGADVVGCAEETPSLEDVFTQVVGQAGH